VLVLSLVFSQGRLLLMKRGLPPYVGRWAPPGGFVEPHESPEAAAVREIAEEVGIQLNSEQLVPHAIISLPAMNQIYVCFLAVLDRMPLPQACAPESLDARWFTLEEYPRHSIWDPGMEFDAERIFKEVQTGQLHFHQCTGDSSRVFGPYVKDGHRLLDRHHVR